MIRMTLTVIFAALGLGIVGLYGWRLLDHRADQRETERLLALQPENPPLFSADMVADLPEPAKRFLTFAIAEGTPLYTSAVIEMTGKFSIGTKEDPAYRTMRATQVIAAPEGFLWRPSIGSGALRMSGSDSAKWTRFWLSEFVPIVRTGGTLDHTRSAFGRYAAEAMFWTPAATLPGPNVSWKAVSQDVARMTLRFRGMEQAIDVTVGADGRPTDIMLSRWSNANPDRIFQLQPFGGKMSEFRSFAGFRVPTRVEAGNFFGTDAYFPFFIAEVNEIRFPNAGR